VAKSRRKNCFNQRCSFLDGNIPELNSFIPEKHSLRSEFSIKKFFMARWDIQHKKIPLNQMGNNNNSF
jgi:hypothetical protein